MGVLLQSRFARVLLAVLISLGLSVSVAEAVYKEVIQRPRTRKAIQTNQMPDGGIAAKQGEKVSDFNTSLWAALALLGDGVNPRDFPRKGASLYDYLKSQSARATTAEELAKLIIVVRQTGGKPNEFGAGKSKRKLISDLLKKRNGNGSFGGNGSSITDTAWAIMALSKMSSNGSKSARDKAVKWLSGNDPNGDEPFRWKDRQKNKFSDSKTMDRVMTLLAMRLAEGDKRLSEPSDPKDPDSSFLVAAVTDLRKNSKLRSDGGYSEPGAKTSKPVLSALFVRAIVGATTSTDLDQVLWSGGGAKKLGDFFKDKQGKQGTFGGDLNTAAAVMFASDVRPLKFDQVKTRKAIFKRLNYRVPPFAPPRKNPKPEDPPMPPSPGPNSYTGGFDDGTGDSAGSGSGSGSYGYSDSSPTISSETTPASPTPPVDGAQPVEGTLVQGPNGETQTPAAASAAGMKTGKSGIPWIPIAGGAFVISLLAVGGFWEWRRIRKL